MTRRPLHAATAAALLALAACDAPAQDDNAAAPVAATPAGQGQKPRAEPLPSEPGVEAAQADGTAPRDAAAAAAPVQGAVTARRCGWLHNPTPGNWWLFDGRGEWILGSQGGRQAEGLDEIPDMTRFGWVETNVHYGYGCACMRVTAIPGKLMVERIAEIEPLPLERCEADKALPRP